MAQFTSFVCRTTAIFLGLLSLSLSHPVIIGTQKRTIGSPDAVYRHVQKTGKAVKDHEPVAHLVQNKKEHSNFTVPATFQDEILRKLSDLQAKFDELSDQNEALRRRLDGRGDINQNIDSLVGKLGRILGRSYDREAFYKLVSSVSDDNGIVQDTISTVSEYLGNREAELASYMSNQPSSSRISFLMNLLGQEASSNETKTVMDFIAKFLVQLDDHADSVADNPKSKTNRKFQNGSANVIERTALMPARVLNMDSASYPIDTTEGVAASKKVAFSVAATASQYGQSGVVEPVHFQDVIENVGGGFQASNHTFICSVPGWYFFTYSLRTLDKKYLGVMLMKNSDYVVAAFTDPSDRNTMETQSAVIALQAGDAVWLRLSPSSEYGLFSDKYRYSTFTGFLLFKQ